MFSVVKQEQILHVDSSDDIVRGVFIHGKSCILIQQFMVSAVDVCKCHMYPGNHDVFCPGVSQVEYVVDHFLFFGFDHTVLMAYIHDCTKFVLSHGIILCIRIDPKEK